MSRTSPTSTPRKSRPVFLGLAIILVLGAASIFLGAQKTDSIPTGSTPSIDASANEDSNQTVQPSATQVRETTENGSTADRRSIDLSGKWRLADLSDTGSGRWQYVSIPSRLHRTGRFSFRKRFVIEPQDAHSHSWLINTDAIGGIASVYVNGRLVSNEAGGGLPRILPISQHAVHDGMNEIDIQVDNRLSPRNTLPISQAAYSAEFPSGLTGPISITRCASFYIESLDLCPDPDQQHLLVRGVVRNSGESELEATLELGISAVDGSATSPEITEVIRLAPGGSQQFEHSIRSSALGVWSASNPTLHKVTATLDVLGEQIDEFSRTFGLRDIAIHGGSEFTLNGSPIAFRGTSYIEVAADSETEHQATIEKDLEIMRTLGINTIRLQVLPSEYLLQRCDALGLLVLAELPIEGVASGLIEKGGLEADADSIVLQAARQFCRHPSVIAIGLGCDNDDVDPRIQKFYQRLAKFTRQATQGAQLLYFDTRFPNSKFALDFAALSTLGLESESEVSEAIHRFARAHQGVAPGIVASTGSFARFESNALSAEVSSLARQSRIINAALRASEEEHLAGAFAGTLRDYSSAVPSLGVPGTGHKSVSCGLIDPDNSLRPAARIVQTRFLSQGRVAVAELEPETEPTLGFILFGFLLLLIFFLLLNLDRRFREYVIRALTRPFNFFADIRDQRLIPSLQTMLLALVVSGSFTLLLAGILFSIREHYSAAWIIAKIIRFESLERLLIYFAWSPGGAFFYGTIGILMVIVAIAGLIRFAAIFVRGRIFFTDTLNVTVWALMPAIVLLPLGMILPRLNHNSSTILVAVWVLILLKLWLVYRLMKGVGVLFDIYPTRIYLYCGLGLVALYGAIFLYWNYAAAVIANWRFFIHLSNALQITGGG